MDRLPLPEPVAIPLDGVVARFGTKSLYCIATINCPSTSVISRALRLELLIFVYAEMRELIKALGTVSVLPLVDGISV